jgi:hypothetical protein
MKAITILQPWASLIACGAKQIETRSWATKYRGPIAIHAGKQPGKCHKVPEWRLEEIFGGAEKPLGAVIAIADLTDCVKMSTLRMIDWREQYGYDEIAFGDFIPGHYAWILGNVRKIDPVPAKGMQRIWNWEGEQT